MVQVVLDDHTMTLGGAIGEMETVSIGGETFLLATGETDNGVTVFRIDAQGLIGVVSDETDDMYGRAAALGGARGVTTATVGDTNFVIVAGFKDNGMTAFEMDEHGGLSHRWSA